MVLHSHKLILKAVLSGLVLASAVPADAGCHSRSSGHSYGSSHSSHQVWSRPIHSVPVYQAHVHSQPVYQQPVYSQSTYPQSQPIYAQAQPQYGNAPSTVTVSSQQSYPISGQPQPAGSMPGNSVGFPGAPVSGSAFPVSAPAPAPNQIPGMQAPANAAYGNGVPITTAPVNAAPGNSPNMDAQQSALQALGGFAPPDVVAAQAATDPQAAPQMSLAGVWTAQLANGSRVQLSLQADGNFSWTAVNKDGQSSVFRGTYTIHNGSLSLTRGNDGQKLDGTMTLTSDNTFSFQLTAAQSASLNFVRG